jgi:hypothetical protein
MRPLLALFIRTFREHSRARSTYIVRGLIALMLLLLLWMSHETQLWAGAPGRTFFTYLIAIDFIFATLAGLGICSGAIAEEKEEGTFGLLRMADLNAVSILLGKGTGRLGILFLFIAVQIPFSFLSVTLGGMSVQQIFTAYTLLGSYLFALANIALLFSVILPRVWRATFTTGLTVAALCSLPALFGKIAKSLSERPDALALRPLIDWCESAAAWTASVDPAFHLWRMMMGSYMGMEVTRSVLTHTLLGLGCFGLAWLLFERFAKADSAQDTAPRRFSFRRIPSLRPPRPRAHAVAWKDFHFPFGGRFFFVARLVAYPIVVVCFIWATSSPRSRNLQDIADTTWAVGWFLFYIEATILTLSMWAPERWQLNLSSLLITPLSQARIQAEKLKAFFIALLPSLAIVLIALAIGGPKFIAYLFPAYPTGGNAGLNVYTLSAIQEYGASAIHLFFFLTLCLNLSLRLKWAALPAALGVLFVLQIFLGLAMMLIIASINFATRGGAGISANMFLYVRLSQLALLAIVSVFLWLNTQRQLTRLAAEA